MTDEIELKTCPFCGRQASLVHNTKINKYGIFCSAEDCSSTGCALRPFTGWWHDHEQDEMVAVWNHRVPTATKDAELEELRAFKSMIEKYGLHNDSDCCTGNAEYPWHIHIHQTGRGSSTCFGQTPAEACASALDKLKRWDETLPKPTQEPESNRG